MPPRKLQPNARVVLILNAFYNVADSLCTTFVGVYFYVNSLEITVVCYHYLALYVVTPCVYIFAAWYSKVGDRVHVFRIGLALHAVYYATLLWLREDSANHPVALGALLGVTWGMFWAGNNVFNFDVTLPEERDYFFGWLNSIVGASRMVGPLISGAIIYFTPGNQVGYQAIFFLAVLLYLGGIAMSVRIPPEKTREPFRILRALFPGKDQRDWQLIMLASATLAGSFHIFTFLLGIVMYMQTRNEINVGSYAAFQALVGIVVSYSIGRTILPATRGASMRWGVAFLLLGGALLAWEINIVTLIAFGFLNAVAMPLFGIPHSSIRFDVIDKCVEDRSQRIEYLCAWEFPLALGRIVMMTLLILLVQWESEIGLRIALFLLCANRLLTYLLVSRVSVMRQFP